MGDKPTTLSSDRPLPAGALKPLRRDPARPTGVAPAPDRKSRATAMLLLATALWGISFPLAKVLTGAQHELLPAASSWFLAALALGVRFGLAAVVLAIFSWKSLVRATRLEVWQGAGLGIFTAGGMLLQLDGLNYTAASTAAFLTSCYSVTIPIFVAWQRRRWPPPLVICACALVGVGMGILAAVDWRSLRLGRGEEEILFSSFFFAGQILWLERPVFARNRTGPPTVTMFAVMAAGALPIVCMTARGPGDLAAAAAGTPVIVGVLLTLTVFCTLVTFTLMNHWQRCLEATEAGLIYCAEPIFASFFALFLPGILSALCKIVYPNESFSWNLFVGGGLITAANVCIQLRPQAVTPVR